MYCPKCGQQVSDNVRFCSRCGLLVSEVAEWLSLGGHLVVREEATPSMLSPRRKGMRRGAKTMFWGAALLPIFFGLSIAADTPLPLLISLITILAGFSLWLYSRLFNEEILSKRSHQTHDARFEAGRAAGALPPGTGAGVVSDNRGPAMTAEMAERPSVTEHTTKLLDSDRS